MAYVKLEKVHLRYPVYGTHSRSLKSSMLHFATGGMLNKKERTVKVEALSDITFELHDKDRLGLVGHNGAGKSTLLKVLAQIYPPTLGRVKICGQANCLFDMMLGLDATLTGYENIVLRGLILGLSKKEIGKMMPEIAAFAELGDYLYMPLKSYSAGMLLRLAFAVVTSCPSDILFVDEIVNVGDANFMARAKERLSRLIAQSGILVLSTHDYSLIQEFCNKVLYLEHGKIRFFGTLEEFNSKD